MPDFYVDDSVQDRGGFIFAAVVFGPDAEGPVSAAIEAAGLRPGVDEFKSSALMSEHPEQVELRDHLREVLSNYRLGVLIVPSGERSALGRYALVAVEQLIATNGLRQETSLRLFLDEEMFSSTATR